MSNTRSSHQKIRVLIAPLDWGLGHVTRCIPIIRSLLQNNVEVLFGGEEASCYIIQKEFPQMQIVFLKGYRIRYSKKKYLFPLRILMQFPKIWRAINYENKELKIILSKYNIDAVISDNRFGFYNKQIPSIYISHQLYIKTGFFLMDKIATWLHHIFINRYNQCWVPDFDTSKNLSGRLSHPHHMPTCPVKYLGPLSRFSQKKVLKKYDLSIVLSGPEPQRTILENIIIKQIGQSNLSIVMVRGLPASQTFIENLGNNIIQFNHLDSNELSEIMQQSEFVVARAGYSTIMDLMAIRQKAILIPTPGQTEQEYLACHVHKHRWFYTADQSTLDLMAALKSASDFPYQMIEYTNTHEKIIAEWISELEKKIFNPGHD